MTTAIKTGTAAGTQAAGSPGICRYPGCASPARVKDPAAPGPRPGYCEQEVPEDRGDGTAVLVRHTAMTAFRRRGPRVLPARSSRAGGPARPGPWRGPGSRIRDTGTRPACGPASPQRPAPAS